MNFFRASWDMILYITICPFGLGIILASSEYEVAWGF